MSITKDQPSFAQATDPPHVPVSALKRPTAELKERHQSDTSDKVYQDNAQDLLKCTTSGHVSIPQSALSKDVPGSRHTQTHQNVQGSTKVVDVIKEPLDILHEETEPVPAGPQAPLGPIDRLVAAKKSRKIGKKVNESARSCRSAEDYHVKFLPEPKIRQLVDAHSVALELTRSRKGSFVAQEPSKFCKILTILYLIGLPTKIRLFVSKGINDAHLPFSRAKITNDTIALKSTKDSDAPLISFPKRGDTEDFLKCQWSVQAYIFHAPQDDQIPHHTIDDAVILPFLRQKMTGRQGVSGKVVRTKIHPSHHFWDWNKEKDGKTNRNCNKFAIKILQSKDRANFDQEVRVLRRLSKERHRHDHLVTLLASYEHKRTFNLIFPLAEMDLFGFWETHKRPDQSTAMARWIAEQCKGLAEALSQIHRWQTFSGSSLIREEKQEVEDGAKDVEPLPKSDPSNDKVPKDYFGVHGDLKPENILWYPGSSPHKLGILKITDFGIARFSRDYSRPGVMPNSPSYRSPEFEVQKTHSPACDVWALGCTFLEFVTWFCGGHDKLEDFGKDRLEPDERLDGIKSDKFFAIYYTHEEPTVKQAKVKDSVVKLIQELLTHPKCIEFDQFKEILETIRDKMLIVHPTNPRRYNGGNDELSLQKSRSGSGLPRRKSSGQVADCLRSMSVFANDVVDLSRQNTRDLNASPAESSMMRSIPHVLRQGTASPQSHIDHNGSV